MLRKMDAYIDELNDRKAISEGTEKDIARQHAKKRLTARERIDLLFDPDTFTEIDTLVTPRYDEYLDGKKSRYGDGVVTGFGLINGRRALVASQDAAVMGGSLGEMHANKIVKAMQHGPQVRLSFYFDQRFRRRAHSRRCGQSRRICPYI